MGFNILRRYCMQKELFFWTGILGVLLFVFTATIDGFFHLTYYYFSRFIGELWAVDAPCAELIWFLAYFPSGFFYTFCCTFSKSDAKIKVKIKGFCRYCNRF